MFAQNLNGTQGFFQWKFLEKKRKLGEEVRNEGLKKMGAAGRDLAAEGEGAFWSFLP